MEGVPDTGDVLRVGQSPDSLYNDALLVVVHFREMYALPQGDSTRGEGRGKISLCIINVRWRDKSSAIPSLIVIYEYMHTHPRGKTLMKFVSDLF